MESIKETWHLMLRNSSIGWIRLYSYDCVFHFDINGIWKTNIAVSVAGSNFSFYNQPSPFFLPRTSMRSGQIQTHMLSAPTWTGEESSQNDIIQPKWLQLRFSSAALQVSLLPRPSSLQGDALWIISVVGDLDLHGKTAVDLGKLPYIGSGRELLQNYCGPRFCRFCCRSASPLTESLPCCSHFSEICSRCWRRSVNSMDRLRCVHTYRGWCRRNTSCADSHLAMPHEPFLQVHTWNSWDKRLRILLYR